MKMRPFGHLIPLEVARRRLLQAVHPIDRTEWVETAQAIGRVAAQTMRASRNVPDFVRATWDGYAISSRSTRGASRSHPKRFRIVGEVFAEQAYSGRLGPGESVAIATGAALPRGTDAVLLFESARVRDATLEVIAPLTPGERVADPGEDYARGEILVRSGEMLTPPALGALAAAGVARVKVYARPRVTLIPNGNELIPPGGRLGVGQIFESNNLAVGALAAANGTQVSALRPVPDDPQAIERAIRVALRSSDLVLVTGGSSVGERDYLAKVFPRVGRLLFHGVAVRPGKPTLAAESNGKLLVGLPGHPASCLSNGFWLLLPLLRRLARLPGPGWTDAPVQLAERIEGAGGGFSTIVPLRITVGGARSTFHGSSSISSLRGANGYLVLPSNGKGIRKGAVTTAHMLPFPLAAA